VTPLTSATLVYLCCAACFMASAFMLSGFGGFVVGLICFIAWVISALGLSDAFHAEITRRWTQ
jgi:hypothetical protein